MKKINKILISLAMVLMFALPLLLTGCGASTEEIGRITIASAKNFIEKHESYENYKNTTYKIKYSGTYKEKYTLSYKSKATDTEYKEGIFTEEEKNLTEMTISFKKMDDEDLALYIKLKQSSSGKGTVLDENDCLKNDSGSYSSTTEYIVSFTKDEEGNKTYYIVNTYQTIVDGEKGDKEVTYKEYEADDYKAYISYILEKTTKCAFNSCFFTSSMEDEMMMMAMFMNYSEKNGVVTTSIESSMPYASMDGARYYSMSMSSSYSKSNLQSAKAKMTMIYEGYEAKTGIDLTISSSANGKFKVPSLEEAEEMTGTLDPADIYIPESIMEVMGD